MNKIIIFIIASLLLISFTSAVTLDNFEAGQNYSIKLSKTPDKYEIKGNITENAKEEINITWEGKNVLIQTSKYLPKGEYEIIFYKEEKVYSYSGGSSSSIYDEDIDVIFEEVNKTDKDIPKEEKDDDKKDKDSKKDNLIIDWIKLRDNILSWKVLLIFLSFVFIVILILKRKNIRRFFENLRFAEKEVNSQDDDLKDKYSDRDERRYKEK